MKKLPVFFILSWLILLAGCTEQTPAFIAPSAYHVTLTVDGSTETVTTSTTNVREFLNAQGVQLNESDEVNPPLFTPLSENLIITVVRVTESIEIIERGVPFGRKIVRSETMTPDDPPIIVQAGQSGLEELTVRIVYRDGLEFERLTTQIRPVEEAQDEIVMIGVGATIGNVTFAGILAYIDGGNAILLRGNSAFPEQLNIAGNLDGRVFALSPTGSHLLYTQLSDEPDEFNQLYVISTEPDGEPRPLEVANVLWADWNPAESVRQQIAYSTAIATNLPPGWEANNDLWIGEILRSQQAPFFPRQIVEAYPATYGWWGGNYEWAPSGQTIAYAYADEVGLLSIDEENEAERIRLQKFTEYTTGGDWAWVPSLSWSPDGRFLAFSKHAGIESGNPNFDTWVMDIESRITAPFARQAGMWTHPHWIPVAGNDVNQYPVAYLQATVPLESERSTYTLWLMDQDGSNAHQLYPPVGENSQFPREEQFMAWGPTGNEMAFIFNNALYIFNLDTHTAYRINQDDAINSDPTWAPYGSGNEGNFRPLELAPLITPTPIPPDRGNIFEDETP